MTLQRFKMSYIGVILALVLMAVGLFMALASPFSLFHQRQSDASQLKSVIIVGRHGDVRLPNAAYFPSEPAPPEAATGANFDEAFQNQATQPLTDVGRERMYLLGKFLKLRYYDRLLRGDSRRLAAWSAQTESCLESAQLLLAGLNPPAGNGKSWSPNEELAKLWQPKAIWSNELASDDLLAAQSSCLQQDLYQTAWKNSSNYQRLLDEFRRDLQELRQNTGLDFGDDLEMALNLEAALRARASADPGNLPAWYTTAWQQRLTHIANLVGGLRYQAPEMQQLIVGRLAHEILEAVFEGIRLDPSPEAARRAAAKLLDGRAIDASSASSGDGDTLPAGGAPAGELSSSRRQTTGDHLLVSANPAKQAPETRVFVYMTDAAHLTALLSSLQVYSSQPNFGSLLLIELHHDPGNQVHFLRLFAVDSQQHNILPEPMRLNSRACRDSAECSPQQFERDIRHLSLRRQAWQQLCLERASPSLASFSSSVAPLPPLPAQFDTTFTATTTTSASGASDGGAEIPAQEATQPMVSTTPMTSTEPARQQNGTDTSAEQLEQKRREEFADPLTTTTTAAAPREETTPSESSLERLEENLIVGPTLDARPRPASDKVDTLSLLDGQLQRNNSALATSSETSAPDSTTTVAQKMADSSTTAALSGTNPTETQGREELDSNSIDGGGVAKQETRDIYFANS